jgi:hypothetical protein
LSRCAGPIRNRQLLEQALIEAQAHTSPSFSASVLVIAFPGGAGTASLVQQIPGPGIGSRPSGPSLDATSHPHHAMTVTVPTRHGRSAPGRLPTALELIRRADATPEPSPVETSTPPQLSPGFSPEQVAALAAPLDRANVRQREQGRGKVNYWEGWVVIQEVNRIFGFDGWQRQTIAVRCVAQAERLIGREQKPGWGVTYTARVRVTVTAGGLPPLVREGTGAGHGNRCAEAQGLRHRSGPGP